MGTVDHADHLGVDIGYMSVYKGNAFAPIKHLNFPTSEKTYPGAPTVDTTVQSVVGTVLVYI